MMLPRTFFLASHDWCSDPRPRRCTFVREARTVGTGVDCILVDISPPLMSRIADSPRKQFDQLLVAEVSLSLSQEFDGLPIVVDIVLCPEYPSGGIDESRCSRIGSGTVHHSYVEALRHSPIDTNDGST